MLAACFGAWKAFVRQLAYSAEQILGQHTSSAAAYLVSLASDLWQTSSAHTLRVL